jgi:hypothetical protein
VPPPAPRCAAMARSFGTRLRCVRRHRRGVRLGAPFSREARGTSAHGGDARSACPLRRSRCPAHLSGRSSDRVRAARGRDIASPDRGRPVGVGTQLHPWVNPPFEEEIERSQQLCRQSFPALEGAKLALLTDTIAAGFGTRPIVYRAGRYGIGPNTLGLLADLGYRIDSSMRSPMTIRARAAPISPDRQPRLSRRPDGVDRRAAADHGVHRRAAGRRRGPLPPAGRHAARPRHRRAPQPAVAGRAHPRGHAAEEALEAVRVAVGEGASGCSTSASIRRRSSRATRPMCATQADLAAFHRWWERIFALLARLGVAPASLAEIVRRCRRGLRRGPNLPLVPRALGACSSTVRAGRS